MPTCIISALQSEIDLIIDSLDSPTRSDLAGWPIWTGVIEERTVTVARAGLGKVNVAALSALLWDRYRPSLLVFTGVAGALDPSLDIGDVVVAERTLQHDSGVLGPGGLLRYQAGHIPFFNPTDEFGFSPSPRILAAAQEVIDVTSLDDVLGRQPSARLGTILTGDQFLQDVATRDRLFSELGAQAIEMEGAAMAQVAQRVGCDHIVIRSVSDQAGEQSDIDFARFLPEVSANSARLALALLDRLQEDDRDLPAGS